MASASSARFSQKIDYSVLTFRDCLSPGVKLFEAADWLLRSAVRRGIPPETSQTETGDSKE
jgi:hypothetical protein